MNENITMWKLGAPLILLAVLVAGCSTVARENIISSIDTGVGATLTENKQTQLYEFKVGYIRTQFYSVPTGKIIQNEKGADGHDCSNSIDKRGKDADITPEVVSGIRMHSGLADLIFGMDVSENFAVGKIAVMSPAAVAMYVADARTNNAVSAANAVAAMVDTKEFTEFKTNYLNQKTVYAGIRKTYESASSENEKKKIRDTAVKLDVVAPDTDDKNFVKRLTLYLDGTSEHTEKLNNLAEAIKK